VSKRPIRIATRGSRLARWQADHVAALLKNARVDGQIEIVHVSTVGDRDKNEPLEQLGGQGVFTREVQKALLDGRADVAVHSLKDLPTEPFDALVLAAVPQRASPYDALVLPSSTDCGDEATAHALLSELPKHARIGTDSLRRRAQMLSHRHDYQMTGVRGNVETRIQKLDNLEFEALVLAEAGLCRLGLENRISVRLMPPIMYPAVGQGALAIECRADDDEMRQLLNTIDDAASRACVTAERRLLADLCAGCRAPIGVTTTREEGRISLEAVVLSQDGHSRLTAGATANTDDADSLGARVADDLKRLGADTLIEQARNA